MSLDSRNPFKDINIIQLEEITHFQKPHHPPPKSILSTHHPHNWHPYDTNDDYANVPPLIGNKSKKVSYSPSIGDDSSTSSPEPGPQSQQSENIVQDEQPHSSKNFAQFRLPPPEIGSDESDSDTEFRRDFTHLPTSGRAESTSGSQESRLDATGSRGAFFDGGISDENLFPLPNDIEVTTYDVIFAVVVFLIHFGELVTDFCLCVWHYKNGQMWGCGLTAGLISSGAITMLHQFGFVQ